MQYKAQLMNSIRPKSADNANNMRTLRKLAITTMHGTEIVFTEDELDIPVNGKPARSRYQVIERFYHTLEDGTLLPLTRVQFTPETQNQVDEQEYIQEIASLIDNVLSRYFVDFFISCSQELTFIFVILKLIRVYLYIRLIT